MAYRYSALLTSLAIGKSKELDAVTMLTASTTWQIHTGIHQGLEPDGKILLMDPLFSCSQGDKIAEKLENPTVNVCCTQGHYCTLRAKIQEGKEGLSTRARTVRYESVFKEAWLSKFENLGAS